MPNESERSENGMEDIVQLRKRNIDGVKTSKEWNEIFRYEILDPDGWDRKNFDFSFNEEKITQEEFSRRVCMSTVRILRKFEPPLHPEPDITEEKGNQIYEIEHIRTRNNSLWMELLRIALRHAPEEAKKVLRKINENDNAVSRLLKELVDE
jgi:hypothetical protein